MPDWLQCNIIKHRNWFVILLCIYVCINMKKELLLRLFLSPKETRVRQSYCLVYICQLDSSIILMETYDFIYQSLVQLWQLNRGHIFDSWTHVYTYHHNSLWILIYFRFACNHVTAMLMHHRCSLWASGSGSNEWENPPPSSSSLPRIRNSWSSVQKNGNFIRNVQLK